ncbi:hypothetical protein AA13595_2832 [Gluconacetobacter johannae DSM 13595]|uniref:chemotaxis protein CheW n=1 Tax=Gluconacetobacter johannae TaxID=112140 RepID=UPI002156AC2D|nr:chemotaxis protein CheW [Gluconacetobacter johannae]GBQ90166.1 hypothetical protein AA13595_2832 [Gluconacetobacter johannae DSM 13595]
MLEERARLLARRGQAGGSQAQGQRDAGPASRPAVTLEVGGQGYAVDLRHVLRITDPLWSAIPRRPDCPAAVRGVYGYVGNLYTVFDLSILLGGVAQADARAMLLLRPVPGLPVARVALLAGMTTGVMDVVDIDSSGPPAAHPLAGLPDGRVVAALDPVRLFSAHHFGV